MSRPTGPAAARLRAGVVAAGLSVAGLAVGAGLVVGTAGLLDVLGLELGLVTAVLLAVGLSQIGLAATAVAYVRLTGRGLGFLAARVPTRRDLGWIGGGYVLALVLAAAGAVLAASLGSPTASNQAAEIGMREPTVLLWLVPASLVAIGPGEELLFRGAVQGRLRESLPAWAAVLAASALFAGLHVLALTGGLAGRAVSVGLLFLPSLVLGVAYERTDNLVVTAAIHGAYDATLFGLLYAVVVFGPGAP